MTYVILLCATISMTHVNTSLCKYNYKVSAEYFKFPLQDFVRSISKLLLAFAVCVGIPLLLQAITDLQQVQYPQRHLDHVTPAPAAEVCPASGDSGDSEDEEKEEDVYVAPATEE